MLVNHQLQNAYWVFLGLRCLVLVLIPAIVIWRRASVASITVAAILGLLIFFPIAMKPGSLAMTPPGSAPVDNATAVHWVRWHGVPIYWFKPFLQKKINLGSGESSTPPPYSFHIVGGFVPGAQVFFSTVSKEVCADSGHVSCEPWRATSLQRTVWKDTSGTFYVTEPVPDKWSGTQIAAQPLAPRPAWGAFVYWSVVAGAIVVGRRRRRPSTALTDSS